MRKWLSLHIGGQRWTVYLVAPKSKLLEVDGDDPCAMVARCDYARCKIYISSELDSQAREDALLHEILHATLYVTGAVKVYNDDHKKDEQIVGSLTPTLHRVLKDLGFKFPTS